MFKSYSEIFRQRAHSYHEAMNTWPEARNQEFNALINQTPIHRQDRICDVPAGGGYLANYLRSYDVSYTAIETAHYFFEQCPDIQGNKRILSELDNIDLPDTAFDIIFSLAGLHHIEDRGQVYRELHRLLKPAGTAVIADVKTNTATALFLNQFVNQHNSMGHEGIFLNERDLQLLEDGGFSITSNKQISYYWRFPSVEAMATYCRLMFGLDQANNDVVVEGISQYLGFQEQHSTVEMNWSLQFLTAKKIVAN
ncbi:methyltransferase domain-containing protein [Motiliproteus sp. MSK22-1]|uniref:methyltransferase domain-containing protein n=1 Tax=Motiliproteus sp. MSK22-1 TaxID=1897630 RepID=UPI000975E1FB|nr:hypothetical protein BGP75_07200 [Motiliproteus sp. MSK22-1]